MENKNNINLANYKRLDAKLKENGCVYTYSGAKKILEESEDIIAKEVVNENNRIKKILGKKNNSYMITDTQWEAVYTFLLNHKNKVESEKNKRLLELAKIGQKKRLESKIAKENIYEKIDRIEKLMYSNIDSTKNIYDIIKQLI